CLSGSPVPQTGVPDIHHSTFESLRLGQSSQSIAVGLIRFWDSLNFKKDTEFLGIMVIFFDEKVNSVIHGLISAGQANHYRLSLKAGSIVKVVRFEVARCSSMYKIIDHQFLIRFIPPTIINEVITSAPEIYLQS
uniref:Replication protein A 70 kDa DNA-binding subunit B/D first OB fold domain-containing protein n=1 Tax=Brassica oleracea var. oleracea TaxID=109376 RepID=A0A0D3BG32_BRAOL